jgi:hypothetical protein
VPPALPDLGHGGADDGGVEGVLHAGDGCGGLEVVFPVPPLLVLLVRCHIGGEARADWCSLVASWWCFRPCRVFRGALEVFGALMSCQGLCNVHVADRA